MNSLDSAQKIRDIISALFSDNVTQSIIQVNDNDFITDEELVELRGGDFGDNDEVVSLLALLCEENFEEIEIVINTSSDGVLIDDKVSSSIHIETLSNEYINQIC